MTKPQERITTQPELNLPPELQEFLDTGLALVRSNDAVNRAIAEGGRPDLAIHSPAVLRAVKEPADIIGRSSSNDARTIEDAEVLPFWDDVPPPDPGKGNNFHRNFDIPDPTGKKGIRERVDLDRLRTGEYKPPATLTLPGVKPALLRMLAIPEFREFTEELIVGLSKGDANKLKTFYVYELFVANQLMSEGLVDENDEGVKNKDGSIDERYLIS